MIRVLILIAVSGFVLALVTLSAAVAIGGPDAIARGGWYFGSRDWGSHHRFDWDPEFDLEDGPAPGPQATRTLAWTGERTLRVRVPAEVRYVQGEGPGTVTITGPSRTVERVVIEDGAIRLNRQHWINRRLTIVVTAPGVQRFDLAGATRLILDDYRQDELTLNLSGASDVRATGETGELDVDISGAGNADLGQLKTRDARVEISGAGHARIAPTGRADLEISGMGNITLVTEPAEIETDISGAGTIQRAKPQVEPAQPKTRT
ncbi:conserved hypothetical protein [Phenylobacterium zucineum HLK1]|uniref:Putative auto-transporter adhesin head GIN domain-containing protein n=1 Tax=Phenylobacterium zucineum (strain HLK1) TaxID=450851 RepID=B4RB09_PHEZH|nr:DUF2807 domain-containing protein [Phenylobacterium zucineum]ACG78060.1 conserved hypothetical protein [Phenylobacterium zucineum HLK1]